jgi:uncharacterized protein YndB with AHSA1/START domain
MTEARYHFITRFRLTADRQRVWEALRDPRDWPSWWRWLKAVDVLAEGDDQQIGARYRYSFGTALPYTLSFVTTVVEAEQYVRLKGQAEGELEGVGLWQFADTATGCLVTYTWLVETTKPWMRALAPVGRPLFSWNHDVLMTDFAKGTATITGSRLQAVENTTVRPKNPGFYELPPD